MSYNVKFERNLKDFYITNSNRNYILQLPNAIKSVIYQQTILNNDISFYKIKNLLKDSINIESNQKFNGLFIGILLNERVYYKDKIANHEEVLEKHTIKIDYVNEYDMITNLRANSSSIGIILKDNFLEKNFSKLLEIHSKDFTSLPSVTLKNQTSKNIHLANDLYNSPFEGELQNIYLQSKVLELIYNEFSEMLNKEENEKYKTVKLTQDDIEALHKVRNLILLENDFSDLMTFSRKVALNEFKLKYGFKQIFNTTIGKMILERKMLYAKQLLETSEFSISEISSFVGYKHQQNFSSAFSQFFGILPRDIMIKRSYYY
ncbi:helix-turn-helix domain-containing protein [Aliarcobacter lanthieri]|uniref:helix-turn-helix domain-containing protein n=1 Tax=Aliarcobacter lanthieri TaxID=1355374 RepID=UPI003AAC4D73